MNIKNLLLPVGVLLLLTFAVSSCQDDINSIGSEVIGSETPNGILDDSHSLISYSKKIDPVQTNRLPVYQLGIYNDPVYGKSSINMLSQLTLEKADPKFGEEAVVDSVFVYVPYFSTATTVDSVTTYVTDSIYGVSPINISIYESKYFLRDYDPNDGFEKPQNYYSDQGPIFESYLGQELKRIEDFKPNSNGYTVEEDETTKNLGPGLRVKLPIEFFQEKIIDKEGTPELRNDNNFKNYLRGLYFKVDSPTDDGSMFISNMKEANITIHYSVDGSGDDERDNKTFKLKFGGQTVNTFDNILNPNIESALSNPDTLRGEQNLYLHGGDGIMSVVELFGEDLNNNGVSDELEILRDKKWLINEANLIFYVNKELMTQGANEPDRIIIYDLKNSDVLADYNLDPTNSANESVNAFTNHFGKLKRGSDDKGDFYKLKITGHVSNLINKDSTNVPLGIVVSHDVKLATTQKLRETQEPGIQEIPSGSVISPRGTILHGNASQNQERRLKLQIYYTEPN